MKAKIKGISMEPTFLDGDIIHYSVRDNIEKFCFAIAYINDEFIIKRVIGVGGDTIEYSNGRILVNSKFVASYDESMKINKDNIVVKEGQTYLLGDNKRNSTDSKIYGPIDNKLITPIVVKKIVRRKSRFKRIRERLAI